MGISDDLLGVLLAVKGNQGHQVLFAKMTGRYFRTPEVHPPQPTALGLGPAKAAPGSAPATSPKSKRIVSAPCSHRSEELQSSSVELDFFGFSPVAFARTIIPKRPLWNDLFEFKMDQLHIVSRPTSLPEESACFSVVLVFKCNYSSEFRNNLRFVKAILQDFSIALQHEQERCSYVSHQISRLSSMDLSKPDFAIESSSLAKCISSLIGTFSLRSGFKEALWINDWIRVNVRASIDGVLDPELHVAAELRPYNTLILRASSLLSPESFVLDSSPIIKTVLKHLNPLKSFQELALELGITLPYMYRVAAHLTYWGKAKVVNTMTKHNLYAVSRNAFACGRKYARVFSRQFEGHSLAEILSRFSSICKLEDHTKGISESELLKIVEWLLQRNLLVQYHTYVFLIEGERAQSTERRKPPGIRPTVSEPSFRSLRSGVSSSKSSKRVLSQLLAYFDGRHHIEEIMWRESISRSDLMRLIEENRHQLVTCLRQEWPS